MRGLLDGLRVAAVLGDPDQLAVEPVGPAVVAAADRLLALSRACEQARAAVAADVAERAQRAVLRADHQQRLRARLRGQVGAGARAAGDVPGELPGALEDALVLEREELWIEVVPGGERGAAGRRGGVSAEAGAMAIGSILTL